MPNISKRAHCRMCKSSDLIPFLNLPEMPLTDYFLHSPTEKEFLADIEVYVCRKCHTAQTLHDLDVSDYYREYAYTVGSSGFTLRFMDLLAQSIHQKFFPKESKLNVLEIGSGDGQQLAAFKKYGHTVLGIEPSLPLAQNAIKAGIPTLNVLFTSDTLPLIQQHMAHADVVIMTYTFDHLPEPAKVLQTISRILSLGKGIFVFENHDFAKITERLEFCLFEHEHSIYLHEFTARNALAINGFKVLDVNWIPENMVRANSLIVAAQPNHNAAPIPFAAEFYRFSQENFYQEFGKTITDGIKHFTEALELMKHSGLKVAGYGAGGRGVMTLAAVPNASILQYVVDKNPKGTEVYMPKTHLPVYPIDKLRTHPVDVVVIFSYGYMEEITQDLSSFGYKPSQLISMLDLLAGKYNENFS